MRAAWVFVLIVVVNWAPACADDPAQSGERPQLHDVEVTGVTIALDTTAYAPGDTAEVTIANGSSSEILFAFICDASVYALVKGKWQAVHEPDCSRVRVRPTRLAPGATHSEPLAVAVIMPVAHDAYRVRLRYQFNDNAGYRTAFSDVFHVRRP